MTFLNQFHKEAMERTMRKIEESKKSPMNSKDFADYMRRNLEQAKLRNRATSSRTIRKICRNVDSYGQGV